MNPDVSKFQWTIIGLLLVLALLEAVVHPSVLAFLNKTLTSLKPASPIVANPTKPTGGSK